MSLRKGDAKRFWLGVTLSLPRLGPRVGSAAGAAGGRRCRERGRPHLGAANPRGGGGASLPFPFPFPFRCPGSDSAGAAGAPRRQRAPAPRPAPPRGRQRRSRAGTQPQPLPCALAPPEKGPGIARAAAGKVPGGARSSRVPRFPYRALRGCGAGALGGHPHPPGEAGLLL